MTRGPGSRSVAVLLVAIAILVVSLMALSTVSTTLMAAEPEGPDDTASEIEAQATAIAATSVYTGHVDSFAGYRECLTGTTQMQMWQIAILTTTVNATVPTAGQYELRSDLAPLVNLPIFIEFDDGTPSQSTQIALSGQENIDTPLETTSTSFFFETTDQPLVRGTKDVGYTGCMTVSSVGIGFSGTDPAQIYPAGKSTVYLPIVEKSGGPPPTPIPANYYDDFSNPNSGWPRGQFGHCSYDYYYDYRYDNWYYRIVADNNERCILPAPSWATQTDGTFEVMASRPGSTPGMYGFFFRAGTDTDRNRWGLEVRPDRVACGNMPFYWLSYINNGRSKLLNPGAESCTNDLYTGGSWNHLKAVSQGSAVWVYLNDKLQMSGSGGPNASQYKYFDLEAIAESNVAVTVYFDWVRFTPAP